MSAEIVRFPVHKTTNAWEEISAGFVAYLQVRDFPQDAIDWIVRDFEPRFRDLQYSSKITFEVSEEHGELAQFIASQTEIEMKKVFENYMMQIVQLEIDLYYAKFGGVVEGVRSESRPSVAWSVDG